MSTKIYTLHDPDTLCVRYCGVTSKSLSTRLSVHISKAKLGDKSHRSSWIRSVLARGLSPKILLVETVDEKSWPERERFWIKHFRDAMGCDLVNSCDGGFGTLNPSMDVRMKLSSANTGKKHSINTKIKISWIKRNMSKETRDKMSFAAKNRSPEHRRKLSDFAKNRPSEILEKISKTLRGRVTPQHVRDKISASSKGRIFTPEHRWKISKSKMKMVIDLKSGTEFDSVNSAALHFGVSDVTIRSWARSGRLKITSSKQMNDRNK